MDIRYPAHPEDFRKLTTEQIRRDYLIEDLFEPGKIHLVYSHIDRIIVGGVCPTSSFLPLEAGKDLGTEFFLARRELGIINIGGSGTVEVDGKTCDLGCRDGLYLGMGAREIRFSSADGNNPAKFYCNSVPAHKSYPSRVITMKDAKRVELGSQAESNQRVIYQYIHPDVLESCQLVMGMTILEPGCVWNTMPCHTHARRMEVYLYFNLPENAVVFHLTGEPSETRHIVVRNEQAVISPSYSIHSGVGTSSYTFIWGMAGENQTFTDMDFVKMNDLR
ncbi:MAG: 5-dehydro-4-deoxy-D-glucuronate isomerase [Syntrophobacteraceae bacterium]